MDSIGRRKRRKPAFGDLRLFGSALVLLILASTCCPAQAEISGADDRKRVSNTTKSPFSSVVHLELTGSGTTRQCSGVLLNATTVLTAAQCIYWPRKPSSGMPQAAWVDSIRATPGRNGGLTPFGRIWARDFHVPKEFVAAAASGNLAQAAEFNYAIVRLANSADKRITFMGRMSGVVSSGLLSTVGYPSDKPTGTLWLSTCLGAADGTSPFLATTCDSVNEDGGPFWIEKAKANYIIGIWTSDGTSAKARSLTLTLEGFIRRVLKLPLTVCGLCSPNAICTTNGTTGTCVCKSGFTGNGKTCSSYNPCNTNNGGCHAQASCTNVAGKPSCSCLTGFVGDGITSCALSNPCSKNNGGCDRNAVCSNPAKGVATCVCKSDYFGSGTTCALKNPCTVNGGGCHARATCSNPSNGVAVCTCKLGYFGDGKTSCATSNPCTVDYGGCDVNAICSNPSNGVSTCACKNGYSGTGKTCTKINACAANNGQGPCDNNAACTSVEGTAWCACNPGFTGGGYICEAINPCLQSNGGCDDQATCTFTGPNQRTCACKTGWTGNGVTCNWVNPCLTSNGGCHAQATCNNTGPNQRTCACKSGWVGDGISSCLQCNCSPNADCFPLGSGTTCVCRDGYYGNGTTCTASTIASWSAGRASSLAVLQNGTIIRWPASALQCRISGSPVAVTSLKNVARVYGGTSDFFVKFSNSTLLNCADGGETPQTGVLSYSKGYEMGIYVFASGTVGVWGRNDYGLRTLPAFSGAVQAASGEIDNKSYFLFANGTVVDWVDTFAAHGAGCSFPRVAFPSPLTSVRYVGSAFGGCHYFAIKNDGTLVVWGSNSAGQTNVPAGIAGHVVQVDGGNGHTVALLDDGTLRAWGDNSFGQATIPAGIGKVQRISAGQDFTLAFLQDGSMVSWGRDDVGQLSIPTGLLRSTTTSTAIATRTTSTTKTGTTKTTTTTMTPVSCAVNNGFCSANATCVMTSPTERNCTCNTGFVGDGFWCDTIAFIGVGWDFGVAITTGGIMKMWGHPDRAIGMPSGPILDVKELAVGSHHTAILFNNGTVRVWGKYQPAGFWTAGPACCTADGQTGVKTIGVGQEHTALVYQNGTAVIFGQIMGYIPLGVGLEPTILKGLDVAQIGGGAVGGHALLSNGSYVYYGYRDGGTFRPVPSDMSGVEKVYSVVGGCNLLVQMNDSTIRAWGGDWSKQATVPTGLGAVQFAAASGDRTLAMLANDTLVAFGAMTAQHALPANLGKVKQVAAGVTFDMALLENGRIAAWGTNSNGELSVPNEFVA